VGDSQSSELRIGDIERDEALRALGEHMRVGRLDVDEYGDRAAQLGAARTRGDLNRLFADLPEPHPLGTSAMPAVQAPPPERSVRPSWDQRPLAHRMVAALVPMSTILAIVLFFAVDGVGWLIFLLPCAMGVITGALLGQDRRTE
jgi:hypothetical protein